MKKDSVSSVFTWIAVAVLGFVSTLQGNLYAQEGAGPSKSAGSGVSAAPATRANAKDEGQTAGDAKDAKDNDKAILTREYAAMTKARPILLSKGELPKNSFTRELYRVEWRAKDPFDLYVIRPKGVAKPPVILYLPSFPDDTEQFLRDAWCETAVSGGYAAVGFVGAVTGHRMRYRLIKEWFVSEMPEALTSSTHDVQLILDYLASRGDFDMQRVGMYGMGSGGAIGVLASVVEPRIKSLYLVGPWGDWPEWIKGSVVISQEERAQYLKPEFLAKVAPLDPLAWLPKVQAKSLCIEDIRGNKSMPDDAQEKLEEAAPDFAVINQYGNGRAFLGTHGSMAVLDWMKSQLAPDAKPQVPQEKAARMHFFPAVEPPAPKVGTPQIARAPTPAAEKKKDKENPR